MAAEVHGIALLPIITLLAAAVIGAPLFKRLGLGSVLYLAGGNSIGPFGLRVFTHPEAIGFAGCSFVRRRGWVRVDVYSDRHAVVGGAARDHINSEEHAILTAIIILSMVLTPVAIAILDFVRRHHRPATDGYERPNALSGTALIIG